MVDFGSQSYQSSYLGYSNTNPSFSSSLLDAIYRSIDQGQEDEAVYDGGGMRKKEGYGCGGGFRSSEKEMADFQRTCMIEKWMEKKAVIRAKSVEDLKVKKSRKDRGINSSSSSSDSNSGGFFSSSEAESFSAIQRPTLVRKKTVEKNHGEFRRDYGRDTVEPKQNHHEDGSGGGFLKTKSRALKIYTDLKKVKQPISPGGKLASFLNSLFAGNPVKTKTTAASPSLKSANCSSASSFSRSCLSKTPSSRGCKPKSSNGVKRSVRFSPVSTILDDSGNNKQTSNFYSSRNNCIRNVIEEELMASMMEKNRRVEEAARDLLRKYHKKNQVSCTYDHLRNSHIKTKGFDQELMEEEDDDDAASCASSDLFELDNLSAIELEELPVYETTRLDTNIAIANGFIL